MLTLDPVYKSRISSVILGFGPIMLPRVSSDVIGEEVNQSEGIIAELKLR